MGVLLVFNVFIMLYMYLITEEDVKLLSVMLLKEHAGYNNNLVVYSLTLHECEKVVEKVLETGKQFQTCDYLSKEL